MDSESEEGAKAFTPRLSLARTPPHGGLTPSASEKRPLTSPAENQPAATRAKVDKGQPRRQRATASGVPPVAGIATTETPIGSSLAAAVTVTPVATATPAAATVRAAKDDVVEASKVELIARVQRAVKGIMAVVTSPGSKLNKGEVNTVSNHGQDILAIMGALSVRIAEMETLHASDQLQAMLARESAPVGAAAGVAVGPVRYASALRLSKSGEPMTIKPQSGPSLAFYPAEEDSAINSSEATKTEIRKAMDPKSMCVGIERVRKVGNAGVVIQTTSVAAAEIIKKAAPPTLRVTEPKRRQPLVALNNVEGDPSFEEVLESVHLQNLDQREWPLSRLKAEMKGAFKKGRRDRGTTTVVFACTPRLRDVLVQRGQVYIGWMAVDVTDFVRVTCCSKCQQ